MPNVVLDMAISVDGFVAGPNDEDYGLHNYFFSPSGYTRAVIEGSGVTHVRFRVRKYEKGKGR